jgi:hypothetical protein
MSHKLIFWIIGLLIIMAALSGRIIHVEGAPLPNTAQASVAATLQAAIPPQNTARQSLIVTSPTSLPTNMVIPTYSVPMLTLRDATNCRTGPGQSYEIIITYQVNQTLEIVGRYDLGNFWLVKSEESPTETCWLWGEYADVTGSILSVVSVTPPPTLTTSGPQPPSLQNYKYYCDGFNNTLSIDIIWADRADNETGYRIFHDGWQAAELPANSTTYSETISMPASHSAEYYIQAYNAIGSASSQIIKLTCD